MESDNIYYGSLSLDEKKFPAAKNWKVGDKYTLTVEVEMTGIRKENDYSGPYVPSKPGQKPAKPKKIMSYSFEVKGVKPADKKPSVL